MYSKSIFGKNICEVIFLRRKRLFAVYLSFVALSLFVSLRLFIISFDSTSSQSVLSGQYSRKLAIADRDGFVFDRNGELLSHDEDGFITYVNPVRADPSEYLDIAKNLSAKSESSQSYIYEKLFSDRPFLVSTRCEFISPCTESYKRYSEMQGELLCHVLGYKNSDGKGICGIRGAYDEYLRSVSGSAFARYEADASGRILADRPYGIYDETYSERTGIVLSIDKKLQKIAEGIADEEISMGAIVIIDTESGEILACVSRPSYNTGEVSEYLASSDGEFINRVFSAYTPGSVFKCIVACAALQYDEKLYDMEYECTGRYEFSDVSIACHNREGHGRLTMREAFSQSCNPYFISLALEIGIDRILSMASALGVCTYDDVNLLPVSKGNLPDKNIHFPANVANTAVGQGEVMLTPLQICSVMSACVSGEYIKPSIVKGYMLDGRMTLESKEEKLKALSDKTVGYMRDMLSLCITDGTGKAALSDTVFAGGKTATAQSGQYKDGTEVIHRIFAGAFPLDEPRYSVCILCDGNGEENSSPSAIFKRLCEAVIKENSP